MRIFFCLSVGLSGSVELRDVLDAEPVHKPLPDGGLEAVAEHDPDFVGGIIGRPWGGQEEPGNLPDVLRRGDVVLYAVLEEVGRGELLFDDGPEVDSTICQVILLSDLHACIKYGFIKAKILKSVPVAEREGGAESDLHPGGVVQGQVAVDHVV